MPPFTSARAGRQARWGAKRQASTPTQRTTRTYTPSVARWSCRSRARTAGRSGAPACRTQPCPMLVLSLSVRSDGRLSDPRHFLFRLFCAAFTFVVDPLVLLAALLCREARAWPRGRTRRAPTQRREDGPRGGSGDGGVGMLSRLQNWQRPCQQPSVRGTSSGTAVVMAIEQSSAVCRGASGSAASLRRHRRGAAADGALEAPDGAIGCCQFPSLPTELVRF